MRTTSMSSVFAWVSGSSMPADCPIATSLTRDGPKGKTFGASGGEPAVADERCGDTGEGEEAPGLAFVAPVQAAKSAQPAHGPLDGPPVPSQSGRGLNAPAGNARHDMASSGSRDGGRLSRRPRRTCAVLSAPRRWPLSRGLPEVGRIGPDDGRPTAPRASWLRSNSHACNCSPQVPIPFSGPSAGPPTKASPVMDTWSMEQDTVGSCRYGGAWTGGSDHQAPSFPPRASSCRSTVRSEFIVSPVLPGIHPITPVPKSDHWRPAPSEAEASGGARTVTPLSPGPRWGANFAAAAQGSMRQEIANRSRRTRLWWIAWPVSVLRDQGPLTTFEGAGRQL